MNLTIGIIGSGFSSLSSAAFLAHKGLEVSVFEKNETFGGRARRLSKDGFHFDIGPTWYWMPGVFDRFFNTFGKQTSNYYNLEKLGPAYRVYFDKDDFINIPSSMEEIMQVFEKIEAGSGKKLEKFIKNAKENYEIAVDDLVYKPGISPFELVTKETIFKLEDVFTSIRKTIKKDFNNPKLIKILEFPVLFLGATPSNTPSLYSFMNYADFGLGTWHPKKGMYSVVEGMVQLCKDLGVKFHNNSNAEKILVENKKVKGIKINGEDKYFDIVLSGADYRHTEKLLEPNLRQYTEKYWNKKIFAPSALMFYVGLDKKLENLEHHTLFFDEEFDEHAKEIYDHPSWPKKPLFYASFPSMTDDFFAPEGKESATFLIPIAPDLEDSEEIREKYFDIIIKRLEILSGQNVRDSILFKESFCIKDFKEDYNSYKGNAYGLANTLTQTAFLRPKAKSKKVDGLFFAGQLTVPGPGVPPSIISGKIASDLIIKHTSK